MALYGTIQEANIKDPFVSKIFDLLMDAVENMNREETARLCECYYRATERVFSYEKIMQEVITELQEERESV